MFNGELPQFKQQSGLLAGRYGGNDPYASGGKAIDVFISTIVLSRQREVYLRHSYPTLADWKTILLTDTPSKVRDIWISRLCRWLKGRAFLETADGHFGLGIRSIQCDDVVTVLLGCQSPIAIRPVTKEGGQCRVIGECFIQGAMFGEVLLGPLPMNMSMQITINTTGTYDYTFSQTGPSGNQTALSDDPRLSNSGENGLDLSRAISKALSNLPDQPGD